jgi:hypothetical protein
VNKYKFFVFALVLINVGYFLWARGIDSDAQGPPSSAPAKGTLKLAREVPALAAHSSGNEALHEDTADGVHGGAADVSDDMTGSLLTSVKRCITIGPFRDVAEAARAASSLRDGGYDPRQRVSEGETWAGVWVYLPRPEPRAAADTLLNKLRAAGIDDALEMPGPTEAPVISLGLFSENDRAQRRVAQAKSLNLKPVVADRKRTGNVFWVDLDLKATDSMLNPSDLQSESGRIMRLEVKACPAAAPRK